MLDAASEVVAAEEFGGFTVDGVAGRSGVAKTTIYRHWPTKGNLLAATNGCYNDCAPDPDTGSLRSDIDVPLKELAVELTEAPWSKSMPGILEGAQRDNDLAAYHAVIFDALDGAHGRRPCLRQVTDGPAQSGNLLAFLAERFSPADPAGRRCGQRPARPRCWWRRCSDAPCGWCSNPSSPASEPRQRLSPLRRRPSMTPRR